MAKEKLVVVVDDDKFMRYAMKRHLTQYGFEVQTLNDGFEVLLYCQYRVPDLIISDIRMPKIDGVELLTGLRGKEETKDVPVIFMSAYPTDPVMEQAKNLGAIFFLVKPFPLKYVDGVLRRALPEVFKDTAISENMAEV